MSTAIITLNQYNYFHLANLALQNNFYNLATQLYVMAYQQDETAHDMIFFNLKYALSNIYDDITDDEVHKVIAASGTTNSLLNHYRDQLLLTEQNFDISSAIQQSGIYIAQDDDPYFLFAKDIQGYHPGLYALSFFVFAEDSIEEQSAKLYIDYGNDFNEEDVAILPLKSGLNERVVYLSAPPITLRFDPLEIQTAFAIVSFELTTIHQDIIADYFSDFFVQARSRNIDTTQPLLSLYEQYNQFIETQTHSELNDYERWININEADRPSDIMVKILENQHKSKDSQPLFSIVIPTYNTQERYLRVCLDSILNQSFTLFEICVADDHSTDAQVTDILKEYAALDERIKVTYRQENGHISNASNTAITMATGRFIVLVDHDDMLGQDALYYCAKVINEQQDVEIIYTDEDKIDEEGVRSNPHFKSDWNRDLLYSQNYVSHLGVYKAGLINDIGGFRVGVEGSQDYDLLLRCLPHVKDSQIIHIPKVLYHWRAIEGSTATDATEKTYTTDAGIKALTDYFVTNGPCGIKVEMGIVPNTYKVNWPIPNPPPKVSLIIPTRDSKKITEQAVRSILDKTTYTNYDILIIDNGSTQQEALDFFEQIQAEDNRVSVIRYDHPFNYSAINNFGVRHTDGQVIGLINNDVEVINPEWLTEMVMHAIRPDIGCVGAKLYYPNGQIQHAGVILGLGGVAGHSHKYFPRESVGYFHRLVLIQNLTAVTAACMLVKRSTYDQVGGLNEKDLTIAFNDVDLCLRVYLSGYRNIWTPYAKLYHHESISRGADDHPDKVSRFHKEVEYMKSTWINLLELDPYYSPNLTKAREDFSIAF